MRKNYLNISMSSSTTKDSSMSSSTSKDSSTSKYCSMNSRSEDSSMSSSTSEDSSRSKYCSMSSSMEHCNTCINPKFIPTCLPPLATFRVEYPQKFVKIINRGQKDIDIDKVCKIDNKCSILSSYSPNNKLIAIAYDNNVKIIGKNSIIEYCIESDYVIEVLDFDYDKIYIGSNDNKGNLFISVLKIEQDNLEHLSTNVCSGLCFKSLKVYEKYILVTYIIDECFSEFCILNLSSISCFKKYIRKTTNPVDFEYIEVCNEYLLLAYDNVLELIKNFKDIGDITTLPSNILSIVGDYWFYSYNFIVSCAYVTEENKPSLLVNPVITQTPGDTGNIRFYYINEEGLFIKNKINIIGDAYSLSLSPDKKTLALVLGDNLIIFDLYKWSDILCGTNMYLGCSENVNIIFTSNSKLFITNDNCCDINNVLWLDVC